MLASIRLCLALLALATPALAQRAPAAPPALKFGDIPATDAPGARDIPALPRYTGAVLLESKTTAFDEIKLPNAKLVRAGTERDKHNNALYLSPDATPIEGRLTRLSYLLPAGRSALEVIRGYQQAVKEAGGSVSFECRGEDCGGSTTSSTSNGGSETGLVHALYPADLVSGNYARCQYTEAMADQRYTLLDLPANGGKAAVLVWTFGDVSAGSSCHAWVGRLVALVVTVETAKREQRMETVKAAALGQGLAKDGRVALYSILFDTGRADIKPESQPQVAELVSYLKGEPGVRALVVGHTDNQGALEYNLDLSRRRAQAVVAMLVAQGIPQPRLVAQGVGMAAPLATNETDEGRSKNRRVELVKQ